MQHLSFPKQTIRLIHSPPTIETKTSNPSNFAVTCQMYQSRQLEMRENLVREKLPKTRGYYLPLRENQSMFNSNLEKKNKPKTNQPKQTTKKNHKQNNKTSFLTSQELVKYIFKVVNVKYLLCFNIPERVLKLIKNIAKVSGKVKKVMQKQLHQIQNIQNLKQLFQKKMEGEIFSFLED